MTIVLQYMKLSMKIFEEEAKAMGIKIHADLQKI